MSFFRWQWCISVSTMEASCAVRVAVRVRPLTSPENLEGAQCAVAVQDELSTVVVGSGSSARSFV